MPQATRQFGKLFLVPAPLDFGCDEDIDLKQVMDLRERQNHTHLP